MTPIDIVECTSDRTSEDCLRIIAVCKREVFKRKQRQTIIWKFCSRKEKQNVYAGQIHNTESGPKSENNTILKDMHVRISIEYRGLAVYNSDPH